MHTLIFDIGKTNKKCFVFDENFVLLDTSEEVFDEIKDEEGDNCDDLSKITNWIIEKWNYFKQQDNLNITKINFSTYGASLVHLDENNKPLTPLYNYLKPYPALVIDKFYSKHGNKDKMSEETASPASEMLNSGLQLFWLKETKPEIFNKLKTSLHFPQYLSFLFTGEPCSEYTSIGCHTALWDFKSKNYHKWVKTEEINEKLAEIVKSSSVSVIKADLGNGVEVGAGIHDSSAALVPYLYGSKEHFVLISTGTWSIVLNPFNQEQLTLDELQNDSLMFMSPDGRRVKASRLFLGKEFQYQIELLTENYQKEDDYFKSVNFDIDIYNRLSPKGLNLVNYKAIKCETVLKKDTYQFVTFEEAYHQMVIELVDCQVKSLDLAIGKTEGITTAYIDGGFAKNDLFCKILAIKKPELQFKKASLPAASAIGAAIVINKEKFNNKIFQKTLTIEEIVIND